MKMLFENKTSLLCKLIWFFSNVYFSSIFDATITSLRNYFVENNYIFYVFSKLYKLLFENKTNFHKRL